ncbi:2-dehydropantoate 2-reductase (Ketopantoate reductase) (KPA reductase) (KPR) [Didymosphaeria variabile]|uniref:2-dehydropantoate 2-reductase n=1 Tax=Didymosphaeria variabile TaxID=1932322 RepID=A0A9W8XTI9_9PLEO|nr:2-dehydropantoate 2-reductase (Ketopantoate reductase) (KPA reductase) (KPR) [Didymosphaeria variabile]KAJ4357360.1 2-dehydropantoate 2-reductase (Ketopantoate reductase) (KPA reductase) (KPR) [Didymosphaeria variabile]
MSRNPADFYRAQPVRDRRIHIMGMGNVGYFVAHSLKGIPNAPPVTLIFHSRDRLKQWEESPQRLQCITDGDAERREGYEAELAIPRLRYHGKELGTNTGDPFAAGSSGQAEVSQEPKLAYGESSEPISSLILCMKSTQVLSALSSVKHRLHKESVICFLQNGMGTVEEVNKEVFPDVVTRPHYMVGINSHGMHKTDDPFTVVHAGFGTISLGILPNERDRESAPYAPKTKFAAHSPPQPVEPAHPANPDPSTHSPNAAEAAFTPNSRYLLRTLLRTPILCAAGFSPPDLLQLQLEKLAVNCIINPLTVMLDARNGSILYNYSLTRVIRLLLSEVSLVIRSLPELKYIPNVQQRFDPGRLETVVVGVANRTRDNISSMLADVRAGRQTEIDYINGWIVKKGEEMGMKCFMNFMLMHMVKGKGGLVQLELGEGIPFVVARPGERELFIKEGFGNDVPLADVVPRESFKPEDPEKPR